MYVALKVEVFSTTMHKQLDEPTSTKMNCQARNPVKKIKWPDEILKFTASMEKTSTNN
jgi:hypothetical protein